MKAKWVFGILADILVIDWHGSGTGLIRRVAVDFLGHKLAMGQTSRRRVRVAMLGTVL